METDMSLPIALPLKEQSLIHRSMQRVQNKMGAKDSIFQMEAWVRDYGVEYRIEDDIVELHARHLPCPDEPMVPLIEKNRRPPNMVCNYAIAHSYGVDCFAPYQVFA